MKWTAEKLRLIFDRTSGKCHICHGALEFSSYGKDDEWEVEHSNPRANGGSDRLSNLYPAHIKCNRSKGTKSTRVARKRFDKTKAPLSVEKRRSAKIKFGLLNGLGMALVSTALRVTPATGIALIVASAVTSYLRDPDNY